MKYYLMTHVFAMGIQQLCPSSSEDTVLLSKINFKNTNKTFLWVSLVVLVSFKVSLSSGNIINA